MFGGHGLYVDEVFVALIAGERLYLKVDDLTQPTFAAAGGVPFVYTIRGASRALGFWCPPAEALDSPALMQPWARLALQAALRRRAAGRATDPAPASKPRPRTPRR